MKHIIFCLLLFVSAPVAVFSQTVFTAGLTYTNGAPTHNPGSTGSRYAIDTVTFNLYIRSYGTTWTLIGQNWPQNISGCAAPAYTPTKFQSKVVINACTPAEMYIYDGSTWNQVGGSGGITGTGLANRVPVWTDAGNLSYESTFRMDTVNNRLILGSQTVTPARTLHVEGEARVSDLTTDTPTRLVGADADGDLGEVTVGSGLSFSGGILSNPNTGTVTGAENGTNIVANKVRLGGPLLATTSIEGDNFDLRYFDGKVSFSSWTGFANTPTQFFQVQALESLPTTSSSPTYDGILDLRAHNSGGSDQPNSLTFGVYPTDADGVWMQSRSYSNPSVEYPLSLQPRGGQASIGRTTGLDAQFTVTATALTGSTASGSVLLLENSEGNAKTSMALGSGSDNVNGEVAMFHTADALRLTNRLSVNGASSVRVAIGGETSDVATFEKSAAASLVQFGVGTTTPHSTLQSAGSLATAYLETVGAPTFDETKRTVVYTATTNISWTIPTAAACACQGREYILHHTGTAGTITLSQNVSKGNGTTFNTITAGQWAYIIYGASSIRGYKITSL